MDDSCFKLSKFHNLMKNWKLTDNPLYSIFLPAQEIIETIILFKDEKFAMEYYDFIVKTSEPARTKDNGKLIDDVYKIYIDMLDLKSPEPKKEIMEIVEEKKEEKIDEPNPAPVSNSVVDAPGDSAAN